ncbi:MAG: riboflavin synthase [Ferruginibacter sp.]|nr:riboflavin synthase [Ferruginibacter sp.]
MFTGIIEQTGTISSIEKKGSNSIFIIQSPLSAELKIDQSVSHNGVCLTVEAVSESTYQVTAIEETIQKTNLSDWKAGTVINLERCMQMNGRMDGHIVQGHVDTIAICKDIIGKNGSWEYRFSIDEKFAPNIIEKGSVAINGISLTLFNVTQNEYTVAIIPYTYHHTNINRLKVGDKVNIEFDVIGKYVQRFMQTQK